MDGLDKMETDTIYHAGDGRFCSGLCGTRKNLGNLSFLRKTTGTA